MTDHHNPITRVSWALIRLAAIILAGVAFIALTSEILARTT